MLTDCAPTDFPDSERELQKYMALNVTAQFHGMTSASTAQKDSSKIISGVNELVEDVPQLSLSNINFPVKAFYLISAIGLCSSSSEAIRRIKGGGVRINGVKILDPNLEFADKSEIVSKILQLGKKTFRRISL